MEREDVVEQTRRQAGARALPVVVDRHQAPLLVRMRWWREVEQDDGEALLAEALGQEPVEELEDIGLEWVLLYPATGITYRRSPKRPDACVELHAVGYDQGAAELEISLDQLALALGLRGELPR